MRRETEHPDGGVTFGHASNPGCGTSPWRITGTAAREGSTCVRSGSTQATAQQQRPDVVCIRGDDLGWFTIGPCHRGMMLGTTPHLDTIAAEGMRFTDDDAEASGSAGLRRHTHWRGGVP